MNLSNLYVESHARFNFRARSHTARPGDPYVYCIDILDAHGDYSNIFSANNIALINTRFDYKDVNVFDELKGAGIDFESSNRRNASFMPIWFTKEGSEKAIKYLRKKYFFAT